MSYYSLALLVTIAFSHSWLECTEYTGDLETFERENCLGLPRPLDANGRNVGGTFGQDIGMDFRPDAGGRCQGDASLGTDANYPSGMRSYEKGKTYTLAWAPKNHVAAECTNAFIPDNFLRLYMTPYDQAAGDPDQDTFKQMQVSASFSDDPHVQGVIDFKGFQNCPRFCDDTDKALCTGTFTVAEDVPTGVYTFQWYWAFNSQTDLYSTCWEANVVEGTGTDTGTGTGGDDGAATTMVEVTTTSLEPTPVGCTDCCDADEIQAPGTGNLISHSYLINMERRTLNCPVGFSDSFDIMCINGEVSLVNGWCMPESAEYVISSEDEEKIKKQSGTIAGLSLALTFVILAFIAYVAITREWVTKKTIEVMCQGDEKKTPEVQKDIESSGGPTPVERKRVESVFTLSNTELPNMPEAPVWYYVNSTGNQVGPVMESELVKYCRTIPSNLAAQVLVWDGLTVEDWTAVKEVPLLKQRLN